jgi:hypothetical protein
MGAPIMKNTLIPLYTAVAALAATLSFAQGTGGGVAQLKDVKGNVLLSREAGLAAGNEASRLVEHTRVITAAGSEVIVVYDNGCEVRLKENQRFEVEVGKPCAALIAQSIFVAPTSTASAAALGFWALIPAGGGAAIGLSVLQGNRDNTPLSPS